MLNRVMEKGSVSPSCPVFTSRPRGCPSIRATFVSGCFLFLLEKSKAAVCNHMFIVNKSDKQMSLKERKVRRPLPWSPRRPAAGSPDAVSESRFPLPRAPSASLLASWSGRPEFHLEKQVPAVS